MFHRQGDGIIALNQSANRDEDVFDEPDRFDVRWVLLLLLLTVTGTWSLQLSLRDGLLGV